MDGLGDLCDNCAGEYNPGQADYNSDGEGDFCDLDDGLIYARFGETGSLTWQLEDAFNQWNAYRGDLATLVTAGSYTQEPGSSPSADRRCRLFLPTWSDQLTPASGQVAFYLITGVHGTAEGSLGQDSSGFLRPNSFPCPGGLF